MTSPVAHCPNSSCRAALPLSGSDPVLLVCPFCGISLTAEPTGTVTLATVIQSAREAGRRIRPEEAARVVRKVAEALGYAHRRGVVHRDVKPANILLAWDKEPLLADFGLAVRVEAGAERLTQDGTTM